MDRVVYTSGISRKTSTLNLLLSIVVLSLRLNFRTNTAAQPSQKMASKVQADGLLLLLKVSQALSCRRVFPSRMSLQPVRPNSPTTGRTCSAGPVAARRCAKRRIAPHTDARLSTDRKLNLGIESTRARHSVRSSIPHAPGRISLQLRVGTGIWKASER